MLGSSVPSPLGTSVHTAPITPPGTLAVFTFSVGSASLVAFRRVGVTGRADQLRGMGLVSPFAFVVSALVIYWVGWSDMLKTLFIVIPGLIWYAVLHLRQQHSVDDLRGGLWLVAHLAFLYLVSALGSFGGLALIPAPWDSALVAVVSFGGVLVGHRQWHRAHARPPTGHATARPTSAHQLRRSRAQGFHGQRARVDRERGEARGSGTPAHRRRAWRRRNARHGCCPERGPLWTSDVPR